LRPHRGLAEKQQIPPLRYAPVGMTIHLCNLQRRSGPDGNSVRTLGMLVPNRIVIPTGA
jgi:hypothetical protein